MIAPVTQFVHPNELCYMLVELSITPFELTRGGRKYTPASWEGRPCTRITWVNRGDVLTEYHELIDRQPGYPGVRVFSLWEQTVGECRGMADEYAGSARGIEHDRAFLLDMQGESTLVKDFLDQQEDRVAMVKNRSTFGRSFKKQRNGFPDVLLKKVRE